MKTIKYICKYVDKSNDVAVFGAQGEGSRDEISDKIPERYISSNGEFWGIFGFPLQQRYPTVIQLGVHFENRQIVYFTEHTAIHLAENLSESTLTAFFKLCRNDDFTKMLISGGQNKFCTFYDSHGSLSK